MREPVGWEADQDELALLVADVFEAAGALRRAGEQTAALAAGQTQARWQLMSVVSVGDWTVPAAADRLGVSRQAVQRIANELMDEGITWLDPNPRHRRSPHLRLTERGVAVLAAITEQAGRENRARASALAEADEGGVDLARTKADLRLLTRLVRERRP